MEISSGDGSSSHSDDDLSLTSTIEEVVDSEEEWTVNSVLAEGEVEGETKYLIDWQGSSLDAATWEPKRNLAPKLMDEWEKTKEDQRNGKAEVFKVQVWKMAVLNSGRDRKARHEARNRKRKRLGLPETEHARTVAEVLENLKAYPDDTGEPPEASSSGRSRGKSVTAKTSKTKNSRRVSERGVVGPISASSKLSASIQPSSDQSEPQRSLQQTSPTLVTAARSNSSSNVLIRKKTAPMTKMIRSRLGQTGKGKESGSNVFIGGTRRKETDTSLMKAATDPTRVPKFVNASTRRKMEKASRDKEGVVAPAKIPANLISLNGKWSETGTVNETIEQEADEAAMESNNASTHRPFEDSLDKERHQNGTGDSSVGALSTKKKKKKVVHWDTESINEEPMDIDPDDSLFVPQKSNIDGQTAAAVTTSLADVGIVDGENPAPSLRKTDLSFIEKSTVSHNTQSVSKVCKFGSNSAQSLELTFHALPSNEPCHKKLPWLASFTETESLIFTHSCTAWDFLAQNRDAPGQLYPTQLSKGDVSHTADVEKTVLLANRLKSSGQRVICYCQGYTIMISPTNWEEWANDQEYELFISAEHHLTYAIYEANEHVERLRLYQEAQADAENHSDTNLQPKPRVYDQFLVANYEKLYPITTPNTAEHAFFLAFPPSACNEAALMSHWLRSLNENCDLRNSLCLSHWHSFVKLNRGVVIIHEDALWAIRHFPGFADILHASSSSFSFFLFTRSLQLESLFPVINPRSLAPGDIGLTQIFHPGVAILITPSFLTSQPEQAYNFVKWFWQNYSSKSTVYRQGTLVGCAELDTWMLDLANQAAKKATKHSVKYSYEEKKRQSLHEEAIEARYKTWNLLRLLILEYEDEAESAITSAPDNIDGNDEQSLVNWFGWWSLTNMDRYRKFTVLGSSEQNTIRLSKVSRIPRYDSSCLNDPNEPYRAIGLQTPENGNGTSAQLEPANGNMQLVQGDDARSIKSLLSHLDRDSKGLGWCPLVIYRKPISYWDSDMSFHFGDLTCTFHSYSAWHNFCTKMIVQKTGQNTPKNNSPKGTLNTHVGFFYTIKGKWHRADYPRGEVPARHPWVAIYRPCNPHLRPWTGMELCIWDYSLPSDSTESGPIYEGDLIEAQQQLIRYIEKRSSDVLCELPLQKVWISGTNASPTGNLVHPLDITLDWVKKLQVNVRQWIPFSNRRLSDRGWKLLSPGTAPQSLPQQVRNPVRTKKQQHRHESGGLYAADDGYTLKSIFHPPRSRGETAQSHKCLNRLYQWAKEAKSRGESDETDYVFRPTLNWYGEQLKEGRGFEHIRVTTWEPFFAQYNIDDPKKV